MANIKPQRQAESPVYEIRVRGQLGENYRAAFPGLRARTRGDDTVLSGALEDRAALYGLLAMIETLGLELVELRQVTGPDLVSRIVRAGELEVSGEDQAELDSYFDRQKFRLHGSGGLETDYAGLTSYFASLRAAFDKRKIIRDIILAEGSTVACQTWIEGTFAREFTYSPAGSIAANGARVVIDLISIFRFGNNGRLIEEFVRTDYHSLLHQLSAETYLGGAAVYRYPSRLAGPREPGSARPWL